MQAQTAAHYDAYPFDFVAGEDAASIEAMQARPFLRFIEMCDAEGVTTIGEIGCGAGASSMFLAHRTFQLVALEISKKSIEAARRRAPQAAFVCGSNLTLPFPDETFDAIVSDGVVHHTPDAKRAFYENVRVLEHGSLMYLAVYNRTRYYYYLYTYLGRPVRRLERKSWGRAMLHVSLFQRIGECTSSSRAGEEPGKAP